MKYVISGASAVLSKLTAERLLETISPGELTMISRSPAALQSFADRGVTVLAGHHGEAESLREGYKGADCLFLISSLAVGERIAHHRETLKVAKEEGVKHIIYTSVAGTHLSNPTPSAIEHWATELMLWESGMSFTSMRNQIYSELMYSMIVEQGLSEGPWLLNSKMGGFAPVSRTDIAACAAAIMQKPEEHSKVVYEITGPERFNFPKVVELAEKLWGEKIEFVQVSDEEMYACYEKMGIPRQGDPSQTFIPLVFGSDELVKQYRAYEMHLLDIQTAHVEMITGNKPRSMESVLKEIITANQG